MSVLGIIGDILSLFGLGSSDRGKPNGSGGTQVRVKRESGDAEHEAAVKGTGESPEHEAGVADTVDADEEPVAADADTAASTSSMTDEEAVTEESAAEPAGPVPTEPEEGEPVDSISGIGPAYAKRLNEAGADSVAELVAADAAELADETGISEKRIRGWQDTAE
jgi:predicted flap endonuclease-1-like 5' DNA nuclease